MVKRILSVAVVLAAAAACAKEPPPASTTGGGGFGSESTTPRAGGGAGGDSSMFRTIYFDFDSSALRDDAREGLSANASYLKSNTSVAVVIEGNTDERGSSEYNLALGKRRAEAAYKYLVDMGIDASRLSTVSFGEEKPAVEGHNELAWAKNRRDDFKAR